MSTLRETIARLGKLASLATPKDWNITSAQLGAARRDFTIAADPAVIIALVQQVEEMRKALEYYRDRRYDSDGIIQYAAEEALAALDKEI